MIRRLTKNDDFTKVAELIYTTDKSLFPYIFGDKKRAIPVIKRLMELGNNTFSFNNTICYIEDNEIKGILVGYNPRFIDEDKEIADYKKVFSFWELLQIYFKHINLKPLFNYKSYYGLYIQNVCVDKNFRGKGIGSKLIERYLEFAKRYNYTSVLLDVSMYNKKAKKLYEQKGFNVIEEIPMGSENEGCYRMLKDLRTIQG